MISGACLLGKEKIVFTAGFSGFLARFPPNNSPGCIVLSDRDVAILA
jgi:hypothetical protein